MRPKLLQFLICPCCRGSKHLCTKNTTICDDNIVSGTLVCSTCEAVFPIESGIPRFVKPEANYCGNFGFQWQEWGSLQVDRLSNHHISKDRLLFDSRWQSEWFAGKLILDAGSGAGRFADIAASLGAQVIAVDISSAIDACHETTEIHTATSSGCVDCIQASLFELPLRSGIFDAIYCMGVIQHTPDPARLMQDLPHFLKPGGKLAYNFYENDLWHRLQFIKYTLRLITPYLTNNTILIIAQALVSFFFPVTKWLNAVPKIRLLNHLIPIAAVHNPQLTDEQQRTWTLLDTFDWYGAKYEKRQSHKKVATILTKAGLIGVDNEPGLAWGEKPKT